MVVLCALLLEKETLAKIKKRVKKRTKMTTVITFSINIGRARFKCTFIFDLKELVTVNTLFNITQLCESLCNLNRRD